MAQALWCWVLFALLLQSAAFLPQQRRASWLGYSTTSSASSRQLQLRMVFDFLKKRSEEGFAQVQNLASKTLEGKLGEALLETSQYVRMRNKIDAENLRRLTEGLAKSRDRLLSGIGGAFSDESSSLDTRLANLEEVLLQADIGASTTATILADLKSYAQSTGLEADDVLPVLRARLIEALTPPGAERGIKFSTASAGEEGKEKEPTVIFVIGANGMGKTTTIGKVAGRLSREGNLTVLLGACDTFRAAAVEQLGEWAKRANVSIEVPLLEERGGDPVPVVTRSVRRAKREGFDVVIIDTSGRLSNNFELTQQLQDMKAAITREIPFAPHETLLVVDGSMGRNAVEQAAAWRKYVGVSGLAITKMDGTARGGFVVSVVRDLGLPVKFIGVGERIDDLRDFDPETFVDALLGNDAEKAEMLKEKAQKMMRLGSEGGGANLVSALNKGDGDAASRLRASFGANPTSSQPAVAATKSKRKPSPKPTPRKKK